MSHCNSKNSDDLLEAATEEETVDRKRTREAAPEQIAPSKKNSMDDADDAIDRKQAKRAEDLVQQDLADLFRRSETESLLMKLAEDSRMLHTPKAEEDEMRAERKEEVAELKKQVAELKKKEAEHMMEIAELKKKIVECDKVFQRIRILISEHEIRITRNRKKVMNMKV